MCNLLQQHLQLILSIKPLSVCVLDFTWGKRCGVHPSDAQPAPLWASNLVLVLVGTLRIVIVKSFLWIAIVYCYFTLFSYIVVVLIIMNLDWFCIVIVHYYYTGYCKLLLFSFRCASLRCTPHYSHYEHLIWSQLARFALFGLLHIITPGKLSCIKQSFSIVLAWNALKHCYRSFAYYLRMDPPHTIFPGCP